MKNKPKSPPRPQGTSIRLNEDDWTLIEALRKKTGIRAVSEIVRRGLRAIAEKEGIQ